MEFGKPKKIFIVDDDEMLTIALSDYLTRKVPHQVKTFSTGEECLKYLPEKPDIIVLDYYLNTVHKDAANGLELLEVIKKHFPDIKIIMLSGQEKYGVSLQIIQKGAEHYIIKDENAFEKIAALINEA